MDIPAKARRLLRIRKRDRAAEQAAARAAEEAAARAKRQLLPIDDQAGFDPYGHGRVTPRFQPGERGRVEPVKLGGESLRPSDPWGTRRRD